MVKLNYVDAIKLNKYLDNFLEVINQSQSIFADLSLKLDEDFSHNFTTIFLTNLEGLINSVKSLKKEVRLESIHEISHLFDENKFFFQEFINDLLKKDPDLSSNLLSVYNFYDEKFSELVQKLKSIADNK